MTDLAERTVAEPAVEPPTAARPVAPRASWHRGVTDAPALGPGGPSLSRLQATAGNGAVTRLLQPKPAPESEPGAESESPAAVIAASPIVVQAKLAVSSPGDPSERAADATASRVVSGPPRRAVAPAVLSPLAGPRRTVGPGPPTAQPAHTPRPPVLPMSAADGPVARAEEPGSAAASPEVTPAVEAMVTGVSGGDPLPTETRARIEPHLGAELAAVRVHTGPAVAAAAASLNARAFTHGPNIFLGAGESPTDLSLMAHESTHVVQQGSAPAMSPAAEGEVAADTPAPPPSGSESTAVLSAQRQVVQRLSIADIPGSDLVMDGVRAIPGYRLLSVVIGEDPLTGEGVASDRAELVQVVLGYGPFAGAVGPVLQAMDALDDVFDLINGRLAENNLTLARVSRDMSAAWDEMDLAVLDQSPNVEIAARYVRAFIADVKAFVTALVADLIAAVREAAVAFAEPLVQSPEIKPVWDLGVKVFHYDPLKDEEVNAPTVEILADFLTLIGQEDALAQMQERETLQKTADWLDTQFATFNDLLSQASALFADAWAAIAPENLANLVENIESLAQRAYGLLRQVAAFATTVIAEVLALVKKSLLGMLSDEAHKIPGFHLLTVILGRNPFTGDAVARTAENLIKGFILLLPNGEQMYAQLAESGVIAEAAGRIETAMTELNISWDLITGTFKAIWDGLQLSDLLDPIGAFLRILDQFGEPLGRIVSFAATVIGVVIELILKLLNFPSELLGNVIANARAAIDDIKRDPVEFLKNIVLAMKQGVVGFLDKIGTYLLQGLTDWLFRGLRTLGIEPPTDLSLQGIITLVLQVLGVSVETLWTKLAAKIGPEKVAKIRAFIDKAGQAWAFVKDVQERGISAVWEFISGQLSNLWDMILNKAKDWIMSEIIDKVTAKLISMLDPTGVMAVINSCIAFFNAVQSAIEYIREILQIVDRYVSTIASIARGNVGPGAKMLEEGLASSVPVAIGFLANQVGLGNVPEKVVEIVQSLRELVDQALDWLFDQAWRLGQAALQALGLGGPEPAPAGEGHGALPETKTPFSMSGAGHNLWFEKSGSGYMIYMASSPGFLRRKVEVALADEDLPAGARPPLTSIQGSITAFEAEVSEHERLYTGDTEVLASQVFGGEYTRPQYLQQIQTRIAQYRAYLEGVGSEFKIKDLIDIGHRSRFVSENTIKPEFQAGWRKEFYPGWAGGIENTFWLASRAEGLTYWTGKNPGAPLPPDFDLYRCAHCGEFFSDAGGVPGYPVRKWHLDHKQPVVNHFNTEGRNVTQTERSTWYNLTSNLQPICNKCNTEDERVEGWTVHRRFRGKGDAPPDPSDEQ